MIQTFKCDGNCSSEQCRAMGGGWYVYGSNGKQGFFRFETAKMGPFAIQQEAQSAGERTWPEYRESNLVPTMTSPQQARMEGI